MRILICDKESKVLEELSSRIERVYGEKKPNESLHISFFDNAFGICDYIETKKLVIDAVFMDVTLKEDGGYNGIEIAKKIKKEYPYINIIFYTENIEYAEAVFEVEPLWLMLKPATDSKIKIMLQRLISVLEKDNYITIRKVGELRRIKCDDIYYVESQGKYVKIHMMDECVSTISKLDDIALQLGENFARCHKSYIVNVRKIKKYTYSKIILFDDTEILVSRSHKAKVKDIVLNQI